MVLGRQSGFILHEEIAPWERIEPLGYIHEGEQRLQDGKGKVYHGAMVCLLIT